MPTRQSNAEWQGGLKDGKGTFTIGKSVYTGNYDFPSRFESGNTTNPEELLAASHAACFSMALSAGLGKAGFNPKRVQTIAHVTLDKVGEGFGITQIELVTEAEIPGIDESTFQQQAEAAKTGCPISKALASTNITLKAQLLQTAQ